jgi:hypothetical protein
MVLGMLEAASECFCRTLRTEIDRTSAAVQQLLDEINLVDPDDEFHLDFRYNSTNY